MLYDVKVQTTWVEQDEQWMTDMTTSSKHQAMERLKYLIPRTRNARVVDRDGVVVRPEGL